MNPVLHRDQAAASPAAPHPQPPDAQPLRPMSGSCFSSVSEVARLFQACFASRVADTSEGCFQPVRICRLDRLRSYFSQSVSQSVCRPTAVRAASHGFSGWFVLFQPFLLSLRPGPGRWQSSGRSPPRPWNQGPPCPCVPVATAGWDPQCHGGRMEAAYIHHILQQTGWE